jgi:hypothetical protein
MEEKMTGRTTTLKFTNRRSRHLVTQAPFAFGPVRLSESVAHRCCRACLFRAVEQHLKGQSRAFVDGAWHLFKTPVKAERGRIFTTHEDHRGQGFYIQSIRGGGTFVGLLGPRLVIQRHP